MGDLLIFLEKLNEDLAKTIIDNISAKIESEEERLLYLIELNLVKNGFSDLSLAQNILNCLMEIRLETANRYGNSFICKNFLGLQVLKVFQIDKAILAQFYGMQHDEMLSEIKTHINNEAYRNDNNITICSEAIFIEKKCPKCDTEKMSVFKSNLGSLAICDKCCFSIKI